MSLPEQLGGERNRDYRGCAYVAGWGEDGALDAIKAYADTIDAVARRIEGAVQPPTETVDGVHTIAV